MALVTLPGCGSSGAPNLRSLGSCSGEFFIENLTDGRTQLFINTQDKTLRTMTNRPLTIGLRFGYRY
jgi:hypothetical protein